LWPQQPGFKSDGLRHLHIGAEQERVYHDRKFDTGEQLKQAIMLEWRAPSQRFIDYSIG